MICLRSDDSRDLRLMLWIMVNVVD